jgi:cytochrome P450
MNARRRVEALLRAQCAAYRAAEQSGGAAEPSLLRDMLSARDAAGQPLSERSLADNFIGLFIAGHDTTACSLSAALFHLAATPDALAALRAEQAAVVAEHGAEVSVAALSAMPVAEAVLREAWRLHPVVPVVGRKATRDVALGEYRVTKGQNAFVALNTVTSGRAGAWAPGNAAAGVPPPEAFAPQRWLPGSPGAAAAAAAQLPFGAGPRACLGANLAWMEAKTILAVIARRLDFRVDAAAATWTSMPFPQVAMHAQCRPLQQQE